MNYLSNITRSEGDPKIMQSGPSSAGGSDKLAKALGWLSIGLGVAELMMPGRITAALGMRGKEGLVRAYGAREVAAGVLTLSVDKQAGLWSRIGGDGLDIATLLTALRNDNPKRDNVIAALAVVAGITLLDAAGAQATAARHSPRRGQHRLYYERSGFPKGVAAARGAAKALETRRERPPLPSPARSSAA